MEPDPDLTEPDLVSEGDKYPDDIELRWVIPHSGEKVEKELLGGFEEIQESDDSRSKIKV